MANSRLEDLRSLHARVEHCEQQMHDSMLIQPKGKRSQIDQDFAMLKKLDTIVTDTKKLSKLYDDEDHGLKDEVSDIENSRDYMRVFYRKLSDLRHQYGNNPNIPKISEINNNNNNNSSNNNQENENVGGMVKNEVGFSGEEWFGRYVDLNIYYSQYINNKTLKKIAININKESGIEEPIDYKTFLIQCFQFWKIENSKKDQNYVKLRT